MSQGFNAYREWLGIAGESEIPSYYELLGLRPFEQDTAQIEAAYQRQSAWLAARLSGAEVDIAQRLMGEIAEARLTLLTPTAKRAYDAALAATTVPAPGSSPSAAPSAPAAPQPVATYPTMPHAAYGQQPVAGYGYPAGSPSAPQAMNPGLPAAQPYPGWQAQGAVPAAATGAMPGYYPAVAAALAAPQPVAEEPALPTIRRRRVRRRSSPLPAVIGVVGVLAVLGGSWLYFNGGENADETVVATNRPPSASSEATHRGDKPMPADTGRERQDRPLTTSAATPPGKTTTKVQPPNKTSAADDVKHGLPADGNDNARSRPDARATEMPDANKPEPAAKSSSGKPSDEMPASEKPANKPAPDKPAPDTPAPQKPAAEKPSEEPADAKAPPEEAAKVAALLKSARAALASREIAKAQDLLAEATIEATAPDTTAEVGRVELLASYVEMFWDAVRQTLPKIGLEELTINGTMMAVVEADENHLVVRAEGKSYEYKWQKLPRSIAYYLANRWLAPDDAVRNLVLASFEIVDPKGDREQAESLLGAAASAGLKSDSLREELKLARAK